VQDNLKAFPMKKQTAVADIGFEDHP